MILQKAIDHYGVEQKNMINKLAKEIHENAKSKGFYEGEKNTGEMLCLIHSEVSEALEADRKGHYADINQLNKDLKSNPYEPTNARTSFEKNIKNSFEDELADIMIRVMDLAGYRNIDLEYHIKAKMKYNSLREYKHGKKY